MILPQDYPISNDDYNYSISEGDLINYCITLEKESLPLSMKENLLFFQQYKKENFIFLPIKSILHF